MSYAIDPEGHETRILHDLVDFRDKEVVEVGCGDGRLTWRYAAQARSVLALDPNEDRVAQALASTPEALQPIVTFRVADIVTVRLPDPPGVGLAQADLPQPGVDLGDGGHLGKRVADRVGAVERNALDDAQLLGTLQQHLEDAVAKALDGVAEMPFDIF